MNEQNLLSVFNLNGFKRLFVFTDDYISDCCGLAIGAFHSLQRVQRTALITVNVADKALVDSIKRELR
jgi:hypothetical protein